MTNQDVLYTVLQEAQGMDRDELLQAYIKTSKEVLSLCGQLEELQEHVEKLEAIVSSQPQALQHYLNSQSEEVMPVH